MDYLISAFLRRHLPSPLAWFRWYTADPTINSPTRKPAFIM